MTQTYFFNENCFDTMNKMKSKNYKVDAILTSPPYNTGRTGKTQRSIDNYENRYDVHLDDMTDDEYLTWTKKLFDGYDSILKENGVILYNISYGSENPNIMWLTMASIITNTNFMIADCIVWKKGSALPNNVSPNKLTRIVEYVFVICRKDEYKTFNSNKKIKSTNQKTGQNFYENVFNFIEAKNNDGSCKLNKATYSTDLCVQLLEIYVKPNSEIYDSFMGTGTTAIACEQMEMKKCFGSELSEAQVEFSKNRLKEFRLKNKSD